MIGGGNDEGGSCGFWPGIVVVGASVVRNTSGLGQKEVVGKGRMADGISSRRCAKAGVYAALRMDRQGGEVSRCAATPLLCRRGKCGSKTHRSGHPGTRLVHQSVVKKH